MCVCADLPALASSALHVVDLSSNALSGALPPSWGYSWQMSLLNLSANALTGPIPDSWGALPAAASSLRWGSAGMPQHTQATLNVVDLSYNKLVRVHTHTHTHTHTSPVRNVLIQTYKHPS